MTPEKRAKVLIALQQYSIDEVHELYDMPLALLKEWKQNPPELSSDPVVSSLMAHLTEHENKSVKELGELLEQKILLASVAVLESVLAADPHDGYTAKSLNLHASTIEMIKNLVFNEGEENTSKAGLQNFIASLTV